MEEINTKKDQDGINTAWASALKQAKSPTVKQTLAKAAQAVKLYVCPQFPAKDLKPNEISKSEHESRQNLNSGDMKSGIKEIA